MFSVKHQTAVPQFDGLDLDVLTEIFHFVHDISRADIFSLICVSQLFHETALPFTVRECALCFDKHQIDTSHARIARWLETGSKDAWVLTNIRGFTVFGTKAVAYSKAAEYEVDRQMKWTPIIRLIPYLANLKTFTFACPGDRVPVSLLQVLEMERPETTLSVKHWGLGACRGLDTLTITADESALVCSPLLRCIEMDHRQPFGSTLDYGLLEVSYVVLKWIIAHSSHLTSLILKAPPGPVTMLRMSSSNFEARRARRAASIFKIPSALPKHKFQCLRLLPGLEDFANFCIQAAEPSSLTAIKGTFPLSQLVDPPMVYQFTALRSLELSVRTSEIGKEALLGDLLKSCAPLQRLSLTSPHSLYRILSIITTHHGPSLHSFTFLHTPVGGGAGDSLSLNDMALLKRKCLCLQKLALTTNRGRRLSDSIGGVGQFTSLSNLTLVFPENPYIMDRSGQSFDASSDEESSPRNAFNSWQAAAWSQKPFHPSFAISIFEDIINKGCSYKKLTIKLGDLARSTRAQKFIVGRSSDGELAVTAKGHALPG